MRSQPEDTIFSSIRLANTGQGKGARVNALEGLGRNDELPEWWVFSVA